MKTKLLICVLATCVLALTAWLVQAPKPAQADDVPEKYRETVRKGLEYLVKHQFPDGHWEGDGGQHPVAMTGLVGLALLMEKNNSMPRRGFSRVKATVLEAKYLANVRKAADWLISKSQPTRDGLIFSDHASETARYMEGHGLATLFLAGVCRGENDPARRNKLTHAVKYIAKAQSSQGGWYHTSRVEGHDLAVISATAIQVQALQAAENAGIAIPGGTIKAAQEYLKAATGDYEKAGLEKKSSRLADTAAALACIQSNFIGLTPAGREGRQDELCKRWLKYCQTEIIIRRNAGLGPDELIHYYYAQTLYNLSGDPWRSYRAAMFDHLQSNQNKDGSWPAGKGIGVGPVYSTAVWCAVLQLDKGSHPSRPEDQVFEVTTRRFEPRPEPRFVVMAVGKRSA